MQEDNASASASASAASFSLSFNCYSSDNLADIAARVGREPVYVSTDLCTKPQRQHAAVEEDDNFEFLTLSSVDLHAASSNAGFLLDGQIREVFPLFDRQLLFNADEDRHHGDLEDNLAVVGTPLRDLFLEDREAPSSSSSSEVDELEGVPPGTYCVWTPPKSASPPPGACKKSKSTGSSSRRWRIRDLLKRSHSDGKESLMFLNPNSMAKKRDDESKFDGKIKEKSREAEGRLKGKKEKEKEKVVSAHEAFYVRNKAMKEGDKRRSYLPYRQDLVGFFANVNGLGRTFPQLI